MRSLSTCTGEAALRNHQDLGNNNRQHCKHCCVGRQLEGVGHLFVEKDEQSAVLPANVRQVLHSSCIEA